MKRLGLDFAHGASRSAWAGRILLGVAAAVALEAGLSYRELRASVAAREAQLARSAPERSAPVRKAAPAEVAAVRETLERLALPWESLFGALESAASEDIALLAIEPDPKAGTVVISGDGRNYLAALSYVLELGRTDALTGVQLVRHEAKADDPQGAVAFSVSAGWKARP